MNDKTEIVVEIFSDVICPWCFIGKRKLESAAAMHGGVIIRPHWRAFLLNPNMPQGGMARGDYINMKFGAAGPAFYERIARAGLDAGIDFNFAAIPRTPDSRPAHALLAAATAHDIATADALKEDLFRAYFMDAKDIENESVLKNLAAKYGLPFPPPPSAVAQVEADLSEVARLGIMAVPYFIFGGSMAISGAQPEAGMLPLFDTIIANRPG